MPLLTTADLAYMRDTQNSAMHDTAEIWKLTTTGTDAYNMPVEAWVMETETACGLHVHTAKEVYNAEGAWFDATLRLPLNTTITKVDRVRIIKRYGEVQDDPITYELAGDPKPGPSGLVVELRTIP